MEILVRRVQLVLKEMQEHRVHLDYVVIQVPSEHQDKQGALDRRGLKEARVLLDLPEMRELEVTLDHQDFKVQLARLALQGNRELQDSQVLLVPKVLPDRLDQPGLRVHKGNQDLEETQDCKVLLVRLASLVLKGHQVI